MAKNLARNLVYYAQLLKMHPLVPQSAAGSEGVGEATVVPAHA